MKPEALGDVVMPLQNLKIEIADIVFVDLTDKTLEFGSRPPDLGRDTTVRDHSGQIRSRVVLLWLA